MKKPSVQTRAFPSIHAESLLIHDMEAFCFGIVVLILYFVNPIFNNQIIALFRKSANGYQISIDNHYDLCIIL
jgi:hypothetical protein